MTARRFTEPSDGGASHRLLNEWAALQFLNHVREAGPWPRLLAASREASFCILEDLGAHPTVLDLLLSDETNLAVRSLRALGSSLGEIHATAHSRTAEFLGAQAQFGASSPRSDSTFDLRKVRDVFDQCFSTLDITPTSGFWSEVDDLETRIHEPGLFTTVIHGDAGPQNFLWTGDKTVLLDYEFAAVGHGLLDLVSARLGFPHSGKAHTVPAETVDEVERSYRAAVSPDIPQIGDDSIFQRGMVDACAHWALVRWAGLWRGLFREDPGDTRDEEREEMRSQAFTVYRRFIEAAVTTPYRAPITSTVDAFTKALQARDPHLTEMPDFPAFANGT